MSNKERTKKADIQKTLNSHAFKRGFRDKLSGKWDDSVEYKWQLIYEAERFFACYVKKDIDFRSETTLNLFRDAWREGIFL